MSVLQAAGNSMASGKPSMRPLRGPGLQATATLGVRSLREDYCKPSCRSEIPRNLKVIEERLRTGAYGKVASDEREDYPRFKYLFEGGELLPAAVFMQALELGPYETINGRQLLYDPE
ncbi:unnamed protein product, partial [Polarella glacialis]